MLAGAGKKDYTKYNKEYAYHDVPRQHLLNNIWRMRVVLN